MPLSAEQLKCLQEAAIDPATLFTNADTTKSKRKSANSSKESEDTDFQPKKLTLYERKLAEELNKSIESKIQFTTIKLNPKIFSNSTKVDKNCFSLFSSRIKISKKKVSKKDKLKSTLTILHNTYKNDIIQQDNDRKLSQVEKCTLAAVNIKPNNSNEPCNNNNTFTNQKGIVIGSKPTWRQIVDNYFNKVTNDNEDEDISKMKTVMPNSFKAKRKLVKKKDKMSVPSKYNKLKVSKKKNKGKDSKSKAKKTTKNTKVNKQKDNKSAKATKVKSKKK